MDGFNNVDWGPWLTIGGMLAKQLAVVFGTMMVCSLLWIMWLKSAMKGKIYSLFLEPNDDLTGELLKIRADDAVPTLESKYDGNHYFINNWNQGEEREAITVRGNKRLLPVANHGSVRYPPGLPPMLQEHVPARFYLRGNNTPIDLRALSRGIMPGSMASALKNVKNQEGPKAMIEKVSDEYGVNKLSTMQKITLLGMVGIMLGIMVVGFIGWQNLSAMEQIKQGLGIG